jgi:hypothetical protein
VADDATVPLRGDNSQLQESLDKALGMFEGWGSKIKQAVGAVAVYMAAKKLYSWAEGIVSGAGDAEIGIVKLEVQLKNMGKDVEATSAKVQSFAKDIQDFTRFNDDAAIAVQTTLMRLGTLDDKNIKRATMAAADLAETLGGDLESAGQRIMMAMRDPERGIMQLRMAGIKFSDSERDMIKALKAAGNEAAAQELILSKLEGTIGGTAKAVAETAKGGWTVFQNKLTDLMEDIGTSLLPIIKALQPALEATANFVENIVVPAVIHVVEEMQAWGATMSQYLGPVFRWLVDAGVIAFTSVQTVVENFGLTGRLVMNNFALGVVKAFEIVKHFLVEAIPEYLSWFGRNWKNIFLDIGNATVTIVSNMWQNLKDFFAALKSWMAGDGFDFQITPLMKGFEAVTEELPKIRERIKSETEVDLEATVSGIGKQLGNAFNKNLEANRKLTKDFEDAKPFEKKRASDSIVSGQKTPEEIAADAKAKKDAEMAGEAAVKEKADKKDKDKGEASFVGLEELNKKIQGAAAGKGETDPAKAATKAGDKTAEATNKVAEQVKQGNKITAEVRDAFRDLHRIMASANTLGK